MRLFVFGTGRCGTVAVANAFRFATNYTVSHEANCPLLCYPDNHISVNPQLRIRMAEVVDRYPDDWYVWLKRAQDKVVRSYEKLDRGEWLEKWWLFNNTMMPIERIPAARIAVDEIFRQCQRAWQACPESTRVAWDIDSIKESFEQMWITLLAEGDLSSALESFDAPVNTSQQRGDAS